MTDTSEIVRRLRDMIKFSPESTTITKIVPAGRDAVTEAADRLEALETENKRLREALEWYATCARWRNLELDNGDRARAALKGDQP